MLPKIREATAWWEASVGWRSRNCWRRSGNRDQESSKKAKGRILDEFMAVTGHHRKHGIRLLVQTGYDPGKSPAVKGRRIYDEAVRETVIVIWEAADRICGKRLKAALSNLVESMERPGHLDLDPQVRRRLLAASASTLDRLLKPIEPLRAAGVNAGSARRWETRCRCAPSQIGIIHRRGSWRLTSCCTVAGRYRGLSSTAWWQPTSEPVGPKPFPCWPASSPW